ncbi:MAG: flagellar synthesis regulator FleN, partial [Candidatus Magnetominusculus sp. LBB02]|nr:flagellar synthesis regulator FleN [Candidatus Magnetominusculus sp. LBB02]
QEKAFSILVNSARGDADAKEVFKRLSTAADKFLNISLNYLGFIPFDEAVRMAVRNQRAFIEAYPNSKASKKIMDLAVTILGRTEPIVKGTIQFFFSSLLSASSGG